MSSLALSYFKLQPFEDWLIKPTQEKNPYLDLPKSMVSPREMKIDIGVEFWASVFEVARDHTNRLW